MKSKLDLLKDFLKKNGYTQETVAQTLGVSQAYVNALLCGRSQFGRKQAKKWSDAFGVSESWLLTGTGDLSNDEKAIKLPNNNSCISNNESTNNMANKFIDLLKKKDEQIDRLLTLLEQEQKK